MGYYVAADGGGTKLQVILYDENFHIIKSGRMSGTNSDFTSARQMFAEIEMLIQTLIPEEISEIEGADLCVLRYETEFLDILKHRCEVRSYHHWGEGDTALAASGTLYGVVAQAGTGSDAFLVRPEGRDTIGGWGYVLGDEGSGYDIGLRALKACIQSLDGRMPESILWELLKQEWKLKGLFELVDLLMENPNYKHKVADAAKIAAKAAGKGDAVALSIYEQAAHEMSLQVLTLLKRHQGIWEGPIVASGGAWKGSRRMMEVFRQDILAVYPKAVVIHPIFEPVAGCAIRRRLAQGENFASFQEQIREGFQTLLYNK